MKQNKATAAPLDTTTMATFATAARRTALAAWTSGSAKLTFTRSLVTHTLQIGEASSGRQVAYRQIPGVNQPSIVYVPGRDDRQRI